MIPSKLVLVVLAISTLGCSYASQDTQLAANSNVGGTGNLKFTHKALSGSKHLLTVTASPGLGEQRGLSSSDCLYLPTNLLRRLVQQDLTFSMIPIWTNQGRQVFMARSKSYVFSCS
jgi:hypothetical protein